MNGIVRTAATSDSTAIAALLAELGYELTPAQVAAELALQPGTTVLVAEKDALTIGVLVLNTRRHLHKAAPVSTIDALVVHEGCRSVGTGAALLERACRVAEELGACQIDLHSRITRVAARGFYEQNGFRHTSRYFVRSLEP